MVVYEVASTGRLDPAEIATACIESGSQSLLLGENAIREEFWDLSTGVAGDLLHRLGKYQIRLAGVVPEPVALPLRFQEFLRETNTGNQFRFFPTRQAAIEWLEAP